MTASFSRRAILGAGVSATLWTASRSTFGGEAPAAGEFQLIEAAPVEAALRPPPAAPTRAFGYRGATPGPLLRLRKGEELRMRLVNKLAEPTTLHWQGLRIVNAMAGIGDLTQPVVAPGASFDYRFTPPDPGLAWYRPHAGALSANQVARGLYGPLIVDEAVPPPVDLEAIVMLRDWALDAADQIEAAPATGASRIGALVAANGAPAPLTLSPPPGGRVRLRLINAAVARVMIIAIEGVKPTIIAIDGQPSEPFEPLHNAFPIGPGARFELMFDMPHDAGGVRFLLRGGDAAPIAGEPDRPVVVFEATGAPAASRVPFPGLDPNPLLPAEIDLALARRVDLVIAGGQATPFSINGFVSTTPWPAKPLFIVSKNSPVTLGLINNTQIIQAIRLHGHVARLLHPLDDGWEPYWRDSVLVAPGKTSHIAFVADNPGRWPIESANLDLQTAGVRAYFEVA